MGNCRNFMDSHNWGEKCCFFPSEFISCGKSSKGNLRRRSRGFGPGPVIPGLDPGPVNPNFDGAFFFRNNCGVISILNRLAPGTALESAIIDGTEVALSSFVSFNSKTNIATFEGADGSLIFANAKEISAIAFPPATTTTLL